ncbi:MAG: hypothetical protein WCJ24_02505 [Candidatus Saccharibacteria bacterium]
MATKTFKQLGAEALLDLTGPPSLQKIKPTHDELLALEAWGFEKPYTGTLAEESDEERSFYWTGRPNAYSELPLLVAVIPIGETVIKNTSWRCGIIVQSDLESATDRGSAILDAAIYELTPENQGVRKFSRVILALTKIIPPIDV